MGGLRLLTDPTFDQPGPYEGGGVTLVKTAPAALTAEEVGAVDAVLLSHDQHPDNLDAGGRQYLAGVPLVLTTAEGAERLGEGATALADGDSVKLPRPDGGAVVVTGVPARHGPVGCEPFTGTVTGFVVSGEGLPTVYVSGDNASLDVVSTIARRYAPIDIALLFAGAASVPPLFDGAFLTLSSAQAADAARILGAAVVVPVHIDSWAHFSQGAETMTLAFDEAGLADRLVMPTHGVPTPL
jgi:L-ascorbate metabolism protein UlaG (beta-lactamase superfamily)